MSYAHFSNLDGSMHSGNRPSGVGDTMNADPRIELVAARLKQASYGPKEVLPPNWSDWACRKLAIDLLRILDKE